MNNEKKQELDQLKEDMKKKVEENQRSLVSAKRENEILLDEIKRSNENEKSNLKAEIEDMKEMLTKTKQNEAENVKIQFAELQNRFLDEIKALNDEQKQIKVRGDEALNKLKKEKSALKTKIDILEASIHEENRSNINKISNFKLKQLNQAKLLEEKES